MEQFAPLCVMSHGYAHEVHGARLPSAALRGRGKERAACPLAPDARRSVASCRMIGLLAGAVESRPKSFVFLFLAK